MTYDSFVENGSFRVMKGNELRYMLLAYMMELNSVIPRTFCFLLVLRFTALNMHLELNDNFDYSKPTRQGKPPATL